MKALTLWQPWSWAIAHAGKRIENRTWPPPRWLIGQRIAIHAGKRLDEEAALDLGLQLMGCEPDVPDDEDFVHGAVESVAMVIGFVETTTPNAFHFQGIPAGQAVAVRNSQWWIGPIGWVLTDVVALPEPVPCRGRGGLWDLPTDVAAEVRRQLETTGG